MNRVTSRLVGDWRAQLLAILLVAFALRLLFFVGYALGDDNLYVAFANRILEGGYPDLHVNQAAYRPLLLYMWAGSIALFGFTDVGVVAPVLVASLATVAIVFLFARRFFDPTTALFGAVLFAFQPFNVVNSTTMTNDVILSCLVFGGVAAFLKADAQPDPGKTWRWFALGGALMTCAFLVKITLLPALGALGLYSAANLWRRPRIVLRGHTIFYAAFLIGIACVCVGYYIKTGDPFWQFRSEIQYYEVNKPDWYLRGDINYKVLFLQYPESLFWLSGYGPFKFFEHGLLFWLFVPAAVWAVSTRQRILSFLVVMAVCVFLFFEFYPHYLTPHYLPLVRQTRYLEMLLPPVVIVVAAALYRLSQRHRLVVGIMLVVLLGDFVFEASRRSLMLADSQQDTRILANYAATTIAPTHKALYVDPPARHSLDFLLHDRAVPVQSIEQTVPDDSYVAVGGSRSFWWAHDLVFEVARENVPPHWVMTYESPGRMVPWRPTPLRVYYTGTTPPPYIQPLVSETRLCQREGLRQAEYPISFDHAPARSVDVDRIPDIDSGTALPAPHLEWIASLVSEGGPHTFETTSDDGSWLYLNDQLVLDNGGVHPVRTRRTSLILGRGLYRFKLRFEDAGGVPFLRVRISRLGQTEGRAVVPSFCLEQPADHGSGGGLIR